MKKLIIAFIAVLALISVSAYAEGLYEFEGSLNAEAGSAVTTVTNTLSSGGSAAYADGSLLLNGSYGLNLGTVESSFTVSARVRVTSSGDTRTLFFKNMGSSSSEKWTGVLFRNGVPTVWTHDNSTFKWSSLATTAGNYLNQWVDIKYVETDGTARLFVNDTLVSSGSVLSGSGTLYLGATYWSSDAISASVESLSLVNSVFADFDFGAKYLVGDLDLSSAGKNIEWTSGNESVLSSTGKVTRGAENIDVTLVGVQQTILGEIRREFTFTVLGLPGKTNEDIVLSYNFEENNGGIILDSSGNNNHGVIFGGMEGTHFDGTDDYVEMPAGLLADLDEFTIVMRLKPEIAQTHQFTFNFGSGTEKYFFLNTSRPTTNTLRLALTQNGSGAEKDVASLPGLRDGEYAALAITVNGSDAIMYRNGIPVAAGSLGVSPSSLGNTTNNWLAKSPYSGDKYFCGNIYEFTIYPRALGADEIEAMHYQAPEAKGYIKDIGFGTSELTVYLNRFCMVSAVFFDDNGRIAYSTTAKASDDDLTAVFVLPEGDISNVELAAYDADRGIIKDRMAIAAYNGVVAYGTDGDNVNITNTTGGDLEVMVMAAAYKDGNLSSLNAVTVNVPAGSYKVMQSPAKDGERLLVWYSLNSLAPIGIRE